MSDESTDKPDRSVGPVPPAPVLVVGIGASSGGLEALRPFFSGLPHDSGLAFVVIQHPDDSAPNKLPEFLKANPEFFAATKQRVESYWNYYYHSHPRAEYAGFRLVGHFESLLENRP